MDTPPVISSETSGLQQNWRWLLALGIALILLGTSAICLPLLATLEFVTFLGILMLMAGVMLVVSAFHAGRWRGFVLHLLIGILYAVSGFLILENPVEGAAGLTLLMAIFFLTSGLFRVTVALLERFPGWGWVLLNGGVNVLLGLVIWRQFPVSALWMIGLLVGFELLFNGWAWVMLALSVRQLPKQPTHSEHAV